ncbi:auxin efflux carrier [Ascobolus immersus RN42]|uniref:Auxin efflux carrier n=1 Tax=Ascobolus immersus RN42 TaxID=1160509 RepID=A0A3N4I3D5_ASCIM|nr:auxin efflux carrier [Ascobolus immersus RN42]
MSVASNSTLALAGTDDAGVGEVIWTSFKPILKMAAVAGGGALFARMGILTPEASKSNAALLMNFFLPLLIFSTVVPSFDSDSMTSVLVIILTGILYQVMGLVIGGVVKFCCPTPTTWRGGVLAAGAFSNWGDLVIAYTATLAKSRPFNGDMDANRGVAYSSIFMVSQLVVLFNLGGVNLVQMDFKKKVPDLEFEMIDPVRPLSLARTHSTPVVPDESSLKPGHTSEISFPSGSTTPEWPPKDGSHSRSISASSWDLAGRDNHAIPDPVAASTPRTTTLDTNKISRLLSMKCGKKDSKKEKKQVDFDSPSKLRRFWNAVSPFISPPGVSLVIALIVANVPPLKALFVTTDDFLSMPTAPDSRPPLDVIMEIGKFAGPLVPIMGLTMLGAAMSRLTIKSLPKGFWSTVSVMSVLKLVVGPIIGVVWTTQMTKHTSLIDPDDKMLQFVMILSSGVPTATSMIYMTTMYAPTEGDGAELSALSACLLGQYALMLVSLTALVSYTLLEVL